MQRHGFLVLDRLGSPRLFTDGTGQLLEAYRYHPFGQPMNATDPATRIRHAGNERDGWGDADSTNDLDYLMARSYHLSLARFLQLDPAPGSIHRPQSLNRYAYVEGNPLRFVDPRGMTSKEYGDSITVIDTMPSGGLPVGLVVELFIDGLEYLFGSDTPIGTAFDAIDVVGRAPAPEPPVNFPITPPPDPAVDPVSDPPSERNIQRLHPCAKSLARELFFLAERELGFQLRMGERDGFRSIAVQDGIHASGHSRARGGSSLHNFGLAFDYRPLKNGVIDWSLGQDQLAVGHLGESLGLGWGGNFENFYDPVHFEVMTGNTIGELSRMTPQELGAIACP